MKNEELQSLEPKIRKIFLSHDADMDGYLNLNEFKTFLQHHLNLTTLDENQIHQMFNDMDKKKTGKLECQSFFQYLSTLIKGDDAEIISASLQLEQQQSISAAAKAKFDLFVALLNADKEGKCPLGGITQFMNKKWSTFNNYIRYGKSGQVVMTGSDNIDDILPGQYSLVDLSCWKDNLTQMIKPLHVKIPNVRWLSSPDKKPGLLIFPTNFNRSIPTDIATSQNLKYYGCAFANDNQLKVSLLHRHGTWDFIYTDNYKTDYVESVNGPGLERHGFAHLDCPHAHPTRSGRFILGKFSEEDKSELHLTAFIIPTKHTLYVPPYTIHSNDYLEGRWRTMLSDGDIDRVILTFERDPGNLETFSFQFPIHTDHESSPYIDLKQLLEPKNSVYLQTIQENLFDSDEKNILSTWFDVVHVPDVENASLLDPSFNIIVSEPLDAKKMVSIINGQQTITPYIIDSLKRYHALSDIQDVFPTCLDLSNNTKKLELFIDSITKRILLIIAIECMSNESQYFLGNFIRKNDLPIPLSYYIWNKKRQVPLYKINFNCLTEILCLTDDRLIIQLGSKNCINLGKTCLLPYIFNDKRKESLSNDGNMKFRSSCIDILFSNSQNKSYVIFDVHGTINNNYNSDLIRSIQLYASCQIIYITEDDLPLKHNNDFLNLIMNYSLETRKIPTIIVIFDKNYDNESSASKLINQFQNYYANETQWSHIYWTTAPIFNSSLVNQNLNIFKIKRRANRLIPTFRNIFIEAEQYIEQQPLFRSCFSIQTTYLRIKENQQQSRLNLKYEIENELEHLFEHLSDKTENLSIVTPLSYLRAQINTIKKKLGEDIETTLGSKLGLELKELENKRKTYTTFTSYTEFIINLINNKTYIELLITEIYLEKWRSLYVPNLKLEKEKKKQLVYEHDKNIKRLEDKIDSQNKTGKKSDYEETLKYLNQLRNEAINLKNDIEKLDLKLYNVDLTIGLFVDELFELYDYYFDEQPTMLDKYKNMFERLADRISQLVYKGFAIHILRGRPLYSQSRLIENTIKKLRVSGRLAVLTVIGEQSSA
ncbi:unnamed protein product, partial [Didymodactylos carnosus]